MARWILFAAAALFAVSHGVAPVCAQSYPQRPVRFLLPFGPGAGVDITTRLLGESLATRWGKPVVVRIGPAATARRDQRRSLCQRRPHAIVFPTSTFRAHPYTHDKLTYDPDATCIPVATVTVIVVALACLASLKLG